MKLKRHGAMVPMVRDSRTEHLIVYYCNEWEELVCLLEAPLEYLRAQQFLWLQDADKSISWQLLTPLTATIECGLRDSETFRTVLSLMGPSLVLNRRDLDEGSFTEKGMTAQAIRGLVRDLRGSFIVEFAAYTNAIRILYFPPSKRRPGSRYSGTLDEVELLSAGIGDFSYSNVHFDLLPSSSRMRADFIVGQLEDPDDLAETLNGLAQAGQVRHLVFTLQQAEVPRRPIRPAGGQQRQAMDSGTRFVAGPAGPHPSNGSDLDKALRTYRKYPTVIAHNLSEPIESSVCSVIKCPTKSGNTIGLGTIAVESYYRMLYDPQSVIRRYSA